MIERKKLISCILVAVMLVISMLSFNVSAKGDVFNVSAKGTTMIEAENCSDYSPELEAFLGKSYMSFNAGQWMDYYINVEIGGTYLLTTYVGKPADDTTITFTASVDGENARSSVVDDSSGWLDFAACELLEIDIPEGEHVLRILVMGGGCHFDSFSLKRIEELNSTTSYAKNSGAYRIAYMPSIVQAEDYDLGANGCVSLNGINDGGKYRRNEPMDIFSIRPDGYYLSLSEGESANYTVNVSAEEIFALYLTMSSGSVNVYLNGKQEALKVKSETEENFSEVFAGNILLEKGEHTLTITSGEDNISLDSFRILVATEGEYYTEKHFETGFVEKTPEPTKEPTEATSEPTAEPTAEPTKEPDPFTDISGHWAYENIKTAAKKDIIKGYPDGTFKPESSLTILDASVLAMRAAEISFSENYPQNTASKYGLLPDANVSRAVTREEFAEMIIRALVSDSGEVSGKYNPEAFADESKITTDRLIYVHAARAMSLMTGDENRNFRPHDSLTRAEASAILTRIK